MAVNLFEKIKYKYRDIENKKLFFSALAATLFAIGVLVVITRILHADRLPDNGVTSAVLELESSERQTIRMLQETQEVTTKAKQPETKQETQKSTAAPQTAVVQETTAKAVQVTAPVPETEHEISEQIVERETIPFEEIVVETGGLLKDDVEEKPIEIISAPTGNNVQSSTNTAIEDFADCIDVSYHNGNIDWSAVKASGINYAFIRVGYRGYETGKLGKDIKFEQNIQNAKNAGVKVGVYFFSQATTEQEALEEASVTIRYLQGYTLDLPVVMDWETDRGYRTYSGLSRQRLTNVISAYCDTVASFGYAPMVYMNRSDFNDRVYYQNLASKYKLWVAWYFNKYYTDNLEANRFTYGDNLPKLPYKYDVWQYTSKGTVNGIRTKVDMNVMFPGASNIYEPKLNTTNSVFVTNLTQDINLLNGVSATGSNGKDAMQNVQVTVKTKTGTVISKSDAIGRSGAYIIEYTLKDTSLSKTATLYVRNIPQFQFRGGEWSNQSVRNLTLDYNWDISEGQNYINMKTEIMNVVSAYYYDTCAGYGTKYPIQNISFSGIEAIYKNGVVVPGTYQIICQADDGRGLNNSRVIQLNIQKVVPQEPTTVPETTPNTETSEIDVTVSE